MILPVRRFSFAILALCGTSVIGALVFGALVFAQEANPPTEQPSTFPAFDIPPNATSPQGPEGPQAAETPEYREELNKRIATFRESRARLGEAVGDMKATYVRYINREQRTPAAKRQYFEQRQVVRKAMDEAFLASLDITRMGFDEDAATFLITMIQNRFDNDIYDAATMEAAARLIDGGSSLTYLFQTAARSAVVEGDFEMAEKLFAAIDEDQMVETDATLSFNLKDHQANFESERLIREKEAAEDRLPRVLLKTTQGDVVLELFLDQAPTTVSNFIRLVEDDFYDGLDFSLVIDDRLALSGDKSGVGSGNSGRFIADEHTRVDARKGLRGSLVMAKVPMGETGQFFPNSASTQFAILLLPILSVSEQQTIFGKVIEGMDAIARLRRVDPSKKKEKDEVVQPPDSILEATVIRRPDHLPEPVYADPRQ